MNKVLTDYQKDEQIWKNLLNSTSNFGIKKMRFVLLLMFIISKSRRKISWDIFRGRTFIECESLRSNLDIIGRP